MPCLISIIIYQIDILKWYKKKNQSQWYISGSSFLFWLRITESIFYFVSFSFENEDHICLTPFILECPLTIVDLISVLVIDFFFGLPSASEIELTSFFHKWVMNNEKPVLHIISDASTLFIVVELNHWHRIVD